MKKIVFLVGSMGRGGAERVVSILTREYCSNGWNVDIIMLLHNANEYDLDERVVVKDFSFEDVKNPIVCKIKMIFALRKYLQNEKIHVLVPFLAKMAVITELASCGMKRAYRLIVSERIDPYEANYSKLLRWMVNRAFRKADGVVFQTERAKSFYSKAIQEKSWIIGNPISVDISRKMSVQKIITNAGRLEKQKNHKLLINAFSKITNAYPEYQLHIYGEGSLQKDLQEQIKLLGLEKKVVLKGNVKDYLERLSEAEIFVLSSDFEGFSNALLEAMMMGIPCITTNCAGANEIINHRESGMICSVGDLEGLSENLRELLEDELLRECVATNGRAAVQKFKTQYVINDWMRALEGKDE